MIEERICARDECDVVFAPKAHNGIYCSEECRRIATNAKVLQRYYDGKDKKKKKKRTCKDKDCNTVLSQYNKEDICEAHKVKRLEKRLTKWGWGDEQIQKRIESL